MALSVRTISAAEHRVYIASQPSVPLEQTPGWGRGFVAARTESVGWFDGETLIGAGLFRYRGLPRLPMRSVAVFESGPDIDWTGRRRPRYSLSNWLDPLVDHLRERGVFTARVNPVVASREWWGFDPSERAAGKELVLHRPTDPMQDSRLVADRLATARWRRMTTAPETFLAEVVLTRRPSPGEPGTDSQALTAGYTVRPGTVDDLAAVHSAITAAHGGLSLPGLKDLTQRWRGLAGDDFAGVSLLVVERDGAVAYGGLYATVGDRAWDLSTPLPLPDADQAVVQMLRNQIMSRSRTRGARTLAVPTITAERRAPVRSPAPGWPPVHLAQLMGTWHFPVRATWHGVLAPVVDRIML